MIEILNTTNMIKTIRKATNLHPHLRITFRVGFDGELFCELEDYDKLRYSSGFVVTEDLVKPETMLERHVREFYIYIETLKTIKG